MVGNEDNKKDNIQEESFMTLPSECQRQEWHQAFFNATSLSALHARVCGVCGRECGAMDEKVMDLEFQSIPNQG